MSIAFIGCGAVGRTLGRLLTKAGAFIAAVCCRSDESAKEACKFIGDGSPYNIDHSDKAAASARLIIIATPDSEIVNADKAIASGVTKDSCVIHLSGALTSSILSHCKKKGAAVGSMHPLQSFADPGSAINNIKDSVFACEGAEGAVSLSFQLAELIGGLPIHIDTSAKTIYHAAAAAASNFLIAPILLAADLMEEAGIGREKGIKALLPLIQGTINNTRAVGVPNALTGPIERGDIIVVKKHLDAIGEKSLALKARYVDLARHTVEAAIRKGAMTAADGEKFYKLLNQHS